MRGESLLQQKVIALFVINDQGELLLHKKTASSEHQKSYVWQTPYLINSDEGSQAQLAAQSYLSGLGITSQIHEVFTPTWSHEKNPQHEFVGKVLIALTDQNSTAPYALQEDFKCLHLAHVINDAHENPNRYTPWFRNTLEGVALYLKNIIDKTTQDKTVFSEATQ